MSKNCLLAFQRHEHYTALSMMQTFQKDHVIILPHAEEYRRLYAVSLEEILLTLNDPELHEGLADERYTVEKSFATHRIYLYYYLTFPLQVKDNALYAIVDFIGFTNT